MTRDEQIEQIKGRYYSPPRHMMPHNPDFCAGFIPCGEWSVGTQCHNKPGHGLGGLFCRQHAKNNPEVD